MANNTCGGGCQPPKSGYQPRVCIGDLSTKSQKYLRISPAATGVSGASDMVKKFQNMVQLGVGYCIKFDPCCTSNVAVDTAANLIQFLSANFAQGMTLQQIRDYASQQLRLLGSGGNLFLDALIFMWQWVIDTTNIAGMTLANFLVTAQTLCNGFMTTAPGGLLIVEFINAGIFVWCLVVALLTTGNNVNTLAQRFITGQYTCGGQACC